MSWEKRKLGDLCSITKGKIGITKAIPGEYPLVVTSEERKSHNEFHFEGEAVVIPLVSSTGHGHRSLKRIHYQTGKFAVGNILCAVIPNDSNILSAEYLYRFLDLNREKELVSRMRGMANVTLPMQEIANIEIPLPSLDEQKKFVEEYKALETANNTLSTEITNQLDLVKQLRQAFLRESMQGKLVEQNEADEPATVLLAKIKAEKEQLIKEKKIKKQKPLPTISEDEIPFEIPDNWVWCRLGEISQVNPRNSLNDDLEVGFCPMPLIYSEYGKDVDFEKRKWKEIKSGFTHFSNNDVVVAKITPCFQNSKAAVIRNLPNGFGAGTTELYVLRVFNGLFPNFIYSFIKTSDFLIKGERIMRGVAGQQRVPRDYVENHLVPVPPTSEQKRIVAKLDELMAYCDSLEESIKNSQVQNEMLLGQVLREALEPEEKEVVV